MADARPNRRKAIPSSGARENRARPSPVPEDVRASIARTTVRTKTWLELDGQFVIGDGGATLMLALLEHGSLLGAAREITWSYRHAWGYLRQAEAVLGAPLTQSRSGRGPARGSLLTETGRLVLEKLLAIRNSLDDALGTTGPTRAEIAARGQRRGRAQSDRATPRGGRPAESDSARRTARPRPPSPKGGPPARGELG